MQIRFDLGPDGVPCQFGEARELIVAKSAGEVLPALAAVDAARAGGAWVAGYLSYEAGYALEARLAPLMPERRRLPLLQFGVYDGPETAQALPRTEVGLSVPQALWDQARYAQAFARLHAYICAGDIYQANLTFPLRLSAQGTPAALYAALQARQPVSYGALITQDGLPAILSRSPELFFTTRADGTIETRPMKGTQPRSSEPLEDTRRLDFLRTDPKNRAENLMIVDLLRNDIARVSVAGSVQVPELFTIESYETVHQMTSRVTARLKPQTGLSDILCALFPCGSITGAPKIRAMEIIAELEETPREIYCGSIGWAAPDGRAEFNVAIRTVMLDGAHSVVNVGGGVVYDSDAEGEYEEALWKARFLDLR